MDILRVVWVSGVTVFVTRVAVASVVAMGLRALSAQMPLSKPGGGIACVLESLSEVLSSVERVLVKAGVISL